MVVLVVAAVVIAIVVKVEHIEEIAEGWAIERHVGIFVFDNGIVQIVAAAMR